jgi:hypothetical protein
VANEPNNSRIYTVLKGSSRPMPPDAAIPEADIELIKEQSAWPSFTDDSVMIAWSCCSI